MTFYEAALRVLESAGRPLHVQEITEQSIAQNMLSHVGKAPERTMLSRLAAMARRTRDRRVIVTARETFALAEWGIPEDAEALAQAGVVEANPEESLPALRPLERHPDARPENVRTSGRPADRRRRRDEEEDFRSRRRKYPPVPELVFDLLSDADRPRRPEELAQLARDRELAGAELSGEQILTALLEDNQRRIDSGRRPQFVLSKESGGLSLEPAGSATSPSDVQAAFAALLGIPIEGGRPVLPRPAVAAPVEALESVNGSVRAAAKEARRAVARELRRRLAELDIEAFHKAFVKVLQSLGFRELKVAKRSRDGLLLTARRREGSVDLRFAIRLLRGTGAVDRRAVQELRRDLGHYSAQAGLIASAGELRGDGRAEAQNSGSMTMVWCADALADKFIEARSGVASSHVELFEIEDRFFASAKVEADEARRRRDERVRERHAREERRSPDDAERQAPEQGVERSGTGEPMAGLEHAEPGLPEDAEGEAAGASAGEFDDESVEGEGEEAKPVGFAEGPAGTAPAERKRRRRRRRGRRGRARAAEPDSAVAGNAPTAPAVPTEPSPEQAPPRSDNETR